MYISTDGYCRPAIMYSIQKLKGGYSTGQSEAKSSKSVLAFLASKTGLSTSKATVRT